MYFKCEKCGEIVWHSKARLPVPHFNKCEKCKLGTLVPILDGDDTQLKPKSSPKISYKPKRSGKAVHWSALNYFSSLVGESYRQFIQANTVYVGKFMNFQVPEPQKFSWLVPYTGNKHNHSHFTHLLLAAVVRAKSKDSGQFPRLIEPFIGSGQIFLNAHQWGSALLNQDAPLFRKVIAGDLNPYVTTAYEILKNAGDVVVSEYRKYAVEADKNLEKHKDQNAGYDTLVGFLNEHGKTALASDKLSDKMRAVFAYIWLVNRCLRGTSLNQHGGISASLGVKSPHLPGIRDRENSTLAAVGQALKTLEFQVACRDFENTCRLATKYDVVVMDCPFPKFSRAILKGTENDPFGKTEANNVYGTGDDGAKLQQRIAAVAKQLMDQGTTVVLCNFANPVLIQVYQSLLPKERRRLHTYTYCSPATLSEAYQLTILPGKSDKHVLKVPGMIREHWCKIGGDDNFDPNPKQQEYFKKYTEEELDMLIG